MKPRFFLIIIALVLVCTSLLQAAPQAAKPDPRIAQIRGRYQLVNKAIAESIRELQGLRAKYQLDHQNELNALANRIRQEAAAKEKADSSAKIAKLEKEVAELKPKKKPAKQPKKEAKKKKKKKKSKAKTKPMKKAPQAASKGAAK